MSTFFPGPVAPVPTGPVTGIFDPVSGLAILFGLVALSAAVIFLAGLAEGGRLWFAARTAARAGDAHAPSGA